MRCVCYANLELPRGTSVRVAGRAAQHTICRTRRAREYRTDGVVCGQYAGAGVGCGRCVVPRSPWTRALTVPYVPKTLRG